jgi:uncharacterized RDD family membrane protein YckC
MSGGNEDLARKLGADQWAAIDPARLDGVLTRRILAYAIDLCIIAVLVSAIAFFLLGATILTIGLLSPSFALLSLVPPAYHTLTISTGGGTWGQRLFGLMVTDMELRQPSFLQALITTVLFYVTVPTTGGLALLAVFVLPRRRTIHDLLAGTQVLRRAPAGGEVLRPGARA